MNSDFLKPAAEAVQNAGGRLLLVGGRVRDHFLKPAEPHPDYGASPLQSQDDSPDFDLTLFGLDFAEALPILSAFGQARLIGRRTTTNAEKEDSLIHLRLPEGLLEISRARRFTAAGLEYSVEAGAADDAQGRDFTLNALYHDPLSLALEDPLGGLDDIRSRRLRLCHPQSLIRDPLRMLRAFGQISRFGLTADPEVLASCAANRALLAEVPPDRFWPEWRKWTLSPHPHLGLEFLAESELLGFWPPLAALPGTPQSPRFHPEGNAWRHTVLVVKVMAGLDLPPQADRLTLILAALLHDVGKPLVTEMVDGVWVSRGHAQAGLPLAEDFLESIKAPTRLVKPVAKLVERHMDLAFQSITPKALKKLARRLAPECNLAEYWAMVTADWNGRGPTLEPFPLTLEEFLEPMDGLATPPEPLLLGRDILENFDFPPGPDLGRLLKLIEEAGDDGRLRSRDQALAYAAQLIADGF